MCCLAKWHAGPETTRAICKVIAWSLERLGHGLCPRKRHDGSDFDKSLDKARIELAGKQMFGKVGLLVMRSDWDWNSPLTRNLAAWKAMSQADGLSAMFTKPEEWLQSLEERCKELNPLLECLVFRPLP